MLALYHEHYPLTLSKLTSLVEQEYLFKHIPSEEFQALTRFFYMECDTDTLAEIHSDFNVNSAIAALMSSVDSTACEIAGWAAQHSIHSYIMKNFKHVFKTLFDSLKEDYMQRLNESLYEDLKPGYCANL